jgi:ASC-1-like (ASCH) protein
MVKKEVFEWIKTGQKTIELRKGKAKSGDQAVFQCGRKVLRGKIVKKDEGSLVTLLQSLNFKQIIPTANSVEEATAYINKLYGSTDGMFTAYRLIKVKT